jgi:hypothetical protein
VADTTSGDANGDGELPEKQVRTEPLDMDEGEDVVIGQETTGRETVEGGGEWPDTDAEPRGPAPGTIPEVRREIEERRRH